MEVTQETIGIIGGLGAEASAKIYLDLVRDYVSKSNGRYPAIVLWNIPITKVQDELLMQDPQGDHDDLLKLLDDGIQRLISARATVIGIACNTIHYLLKRLPSYKVKLLDLADITVLRVQELQLRNVGLLATSATIKSGIYTNLFKQKNINVVLPADLHQEQLMRIIFKVLDSKDHTELKEQIRNIVYELKVHTIILGCTELPLIINQGDYNDIRIIDSLNVLKEELLEFESTIEESF